MHLDNTSTSRRRFDPNDPLFTLRQYLGDVADVAVLTRDQEFELGERLREHSAAFREALAEIPFTARHAVARWRETRAAGRTSATMAASWRDPHSKNPASRVDRGLERAAALLDHGVRSADRRRALARHLEDADLSMAVYEEAWNALQQAVEAGRTRGVGLPATSLRTRMQRIRSHHQELIEARNEFARHNLKFVIHLAKGFRSLGMPFEDLIQEGNIGLIRAVEKFDARRGFKFTTYAAWWIRQSFIRLAQSQSRTVRLPSHVYDLALREKRERAQMERRLGRTPRAEEMAEALGIETGDIEDLYRATRKIRSLDDAAPGREDQTAVELIDDPDVPDPSHAIHERTIAPHVSGLLDALDERERTVVRLRFGLQGEETRTLQEIGDELGISRERVRQIERGALDKMRVGARRCGLDPHEGWRMGA
jgi:RNA polymerase sigma factor (sigma-70 family)